MNPHSDPATNTDPIRQQSERATDSVELQLRNSPGYPITATSALPVVAPEVRTALIKSYPARLSPSDLQEHANAFKARYPEVFQAMYGSKMDPTVDYNQPGSEYDTFRDLEDTRNIGQHCVMHARGTTILAALAVQAGVLDESRLEETIKGGLGHDLNKPREINLKKVVEQQFAALPRDELNRILAAEVYSEEGYVSRLPQVFQVDRSLINLFRGSSSQTGHLANTSFIVTAENGALLAQVKTENIPGLIINLVDAMLYSVRPEFNKATGTTSWPEPEEHVFMDPTHRMIAQRFEKLYGFMWQEGVGRSVLGANFNHAALQHGAVAERIDRNGEKVWVQYSKASWVGHYAGIQAHLGEVSAKFFVDCGLTLGDPDMRQVRADSTLSAGEVLARYLGRKIVELK